MAVSSALGVSAPKVEPPVQDDRQSGEAGPVQAAALEPRAGRTRWLWGEARSTEGGEPGAVAHRVSRRDPPAQVGVPKPEQAPRSSPRAGYQAGAAAPHQLAGCPRALVVDGPPAGRGTPGACGPPTGRPAGGRGTPLTCGPPGGGCRPLARGPAGG